MHAEKEYHLPCWTYAKILANGQARMRQTFGISPHRYSPKFQLVTRIARTRQGHGQDNLTGLVTYICLYVYVCNHCPEDVQIDESTWHRVMFSAGVGRRSQRHGGFIPRDRVRELAREHAWALARS